MIKILFFTIFSFYFSQVEIWTKTYENYSKPFTISKTVDGGYIGGNNSNILVKFDSQANIEWESTIPIGSINTVKQTSDGGYILSTNSSGYN